MSIRSSSWYLAVVLAALTLSCSSEPGSPTGPSQDDAAADEDAATTQEPEDAAEPEDVAESERQLEPYVNAGAVERPPPDGDTCAIASYVHDHLGFGLDIVRTGAAMYAHGEPIMRGPLPYAARHLDRAIDGIAALDAPELAEVVEASAGLSGEVDGLAVADLDEDELGMRLTELREGWPYGDAGRHPEPWTDWIRTAGC